MFDRIGQEVTGGFAGIDIETSHPVSMIVDKHQAGALLVGIIIGGRSPAGIGHVGDVPLADAVGIGSVFSAGGDPLMRRSITDPGSETAMEMNHGAVLGVK